MINRIATVLSLSSLLSTALSVSADEPVPDSIQQLAEQLQAWSSIRGHQAGNHEKRTRAGTNAARDHVVLTEEYEYDGPQYRVHRLQRKVYIFKPDRMDPESISIEEKAWYDTGKTHFVVAVKTLGLDESAAYESTDTWTVRGEVTEETFSGSVSEFVVGYFDERQRAEQVAETIRTLLRARNIGDEPEDDSE